jgi:CBS domain-containing protein
MEDAMKIQEIMSSSVHSIRPAETIADAARSMAKHDIGALPVIEGGKVIGMVTDRDIAIRAVAGAIESGKEVREIMTGSVVTCSPDDDIEDALGLMSKQQIRRLPVCKADGALVGMVTLADAAERDADKEEVGETLAEVCEPGGLHSQAPVFA